MKKMFFLLIIILIAISYVTSEIKLYATNDAAIIPEKCREIMRKIGKDECFVENLYDFNSDFHYLMVYGEDFYIIYDWHSDNYVEYSPCTSSPYALLKKYDEKIYAGPGSYFYSRDGKIYNIISDDSPLTSEETNCYKKIANILSYKMNSNKQHNNRASAFISNAFYFVSLHTNFGSNTSTLYPNSCSYVAMEIMLSYYDTFYSDNIISETYDVNVYQNFSAYSNINFLGYSESPGINDTFHSYMIDLGRAWEYTEPTSCMLSFGQIDDFLTNYFNGTSISFGYQFYSGTNLISNIQSCINGGVPVLLKYENNPGASIPYHAVVGFGYTDDGIFVHTGWKSPLSTFLVINNNDIDSALSLTLNTASTVNSNNYRWTSSNCFGHLCGNGTIVCNHNLSYNGNYDISGHYLNCDFCGGTVVVPHDFVPYGLGYICSVCGYYTRWPIIINGSTISE